MMTDKELVVFVDKNGKPTGETGPKLASHHADTKLHLGFSCYVFNELGELLVTQRAMSKKVWPGVWTNTVCGHPAPGEQMADAISRRLDFELGMTVDQLRVVLPKYTYKTTPYNNIIENEFCPVHVAIATSEPQPNPEEVEAFKWMTWQDYVAEALADTDDSWSYWCKDQIQQLRNQPLITQYAKLD